ncbi:hypothetical protein INR49_008889 [Caranx melampygus]|nr:hypothetical protein INR49_008889 [Caranx melampygus]
MKLLVLVLLQLILLAPSSAIDTFEDTVGGSITASFPFVSASLSFSTATTKQFTQGTTISETVTHSVTVEENVPPNHMCSATMVAYKYEARIPFTAVIEYVTKRRQYRTSISGTYDSIQVGEVRAVVDRCEPIPNATPCP